MFPHFAVSTILCILYVQSWPDGHYNNVPQLLHFLGFCNILGGRNKNIKSGFFWVHYIFVTLALQIFVCFVYCHFKKVENGYSNRCNKIITKEYIISGELFSWCHVYTMGSAVFSLCCVIDIIYLLTAIG